MIHAGSRANSLNIISDFMIDHEETIAVAESVTSGCIQTLLSSANQASRFFQGGITAYNLHQKITHLDVDPLQALHNNCVSEAVAAQMAIGVTHKFNADWGISITGYASVIPEQGINTLFAFYAFAYKGQSVQTNLILSPLKDSTHVQRHYAESLIGNFARYLQEASVAVRT